MRKIDINTIKGNRNTNDDPYNDYYSEESNDNNTSDNQQNNSNPVQTQITASPIKNNISKSVSVKKPEYIEGKVANVTEQDVKQLYIVKWFRSVINGVPFYFEDTQNIFELNDVSNSNGNSMGNVDVIIYGKIVGGKPNNHNKVRAWGSFNSSNSFIVSKMINVNTNSRLQINNSVSSLTIRIITILIMLLLVILATGVSGITLEDVFATIIEISLLIIGVIIGWKILMRKLFGRR